MYSFVTFLNDESARIKKLFIIFLNDPPLTLSVNKFPTLKTTVLYFFGIAI
mgnify:CR=1 FL=1